MSSIRLKVPNVYEGVRSRLLNLDLKSFHYEELTLKKFPMWKSAAVSACGFLLFYASFAVIFYGGAQIVSINGMTGGEIVQILICVVHVVVKVPIPDLRKFFKWASSLKISTHTRSSMARGSLIIPLFDKVVLENLTSGFEYVDLNFVVQDGVNFLVSGSRLIEVLAGFIKPDYGCIKIDGYDLTRLSEIAKQQIAVATSLILKDSSILSNLTMGRKVQYTTLVSACKMAGFMSVVTKQGGFSKKLGNISLFERRKLQLARSLCFQPKLLLLPNFIDGLAKNEIKELSDILTTLPCKVVITHESYNSSLESAQILWHQGSILLKVTREEAVMLQETKQTKQVKFLDQERNPQELVNSQKVGLKIVWQLLTKSQVTLVCLSLFGAAFSGFLTSCFSIVFSSILDACTGSSVLQQETYFWCLCFVAIALNAWTGYFVQYYFLERVGFGVQQWCCNSILKSKLNRFRNGDDHLPMSMSVFATEIMCQMQCYGQAFKLYIHQRFGIVVQLAVCVIGGVVVAVGYDWLLACGICCLMLLQLVAETLSYWVRSCYRKDQLRVQDKMNVYYSQFENDYEMLARLQVENYLKRSLWLIKLKLEFICWFKHARANVFHLLTKALMIANMSAAFWLTKLQYDNGMHSKSIKFAVLVWLALTFSWISLKKLVQLHYYDMTDSVQLIKEFDMFIQEPAHRFSNQVSSAFLFETAQEKFSEPSPRSNSMTPECLALSYASLSSVLTSCDLLDPFTVSTTSVGSIVQVSEFAIGFKIRQLYSDLISDWNLDILPGQCLFLVGNTQVQDSFIQIVSAWDSLYSGDVRLVRYNGYSSSSLDIRQINPVEYRSSIGAITHDFKLFRGTLIENLQFALNNVSFGNVVIACQLSGLHQVVLSLPNGYDTLVDSSCTLEFQLLVNISRIVMQKPKVLLLESVDLLTFKSLTIANLFEVCRDSTIIASIENPSELDSFKATRNLTNPVNSEVVQIVSDYGDLVPTVM